MSNSWNNLDKYMDFDMPKHINYWLERQLEFNYKSYTEVMEFEKDLEKLYKKTFNDIKKDIQLYYKEFADANNISIKEAKKWLDVKDLEEFKFKVSILTAEMERRGVDQSIISKYTNYTERLKINRLQSILVEISGELEILYTQFNTDATSFLTKNIINGYLQQGYILSTQIKTVVKMNGLNRDIIEKMLQVKWVDDSNYSSRIWGEKTKLQEILQKVLIQDTILGKSEKEVTEEIMQHFKVKYHEAQRLIRTESHYYSEQGIKKGYEAIGINQYEFLAVHPRNTVTRGKKIKGSPICTALDHQVFELKNSIVGGNYPPIHPNCRSVTGAVVDEEFYKERRKEIKNRIEASKDLTFEEYKEKYYPKKYNF